MRKAILTICVLFYAAISMMAQEFQISSPNGSIGLEVNCSNQLSYSIVYNGQPILAPSPLGFELKGERAMGDSLVLIGQPEVKSGHDHWIPVVKNKHAEVDMMWNEATLQLQEQGGERRRMDLQVKVFNEGVAFRYHLYDDHRLVPREITKELTGFYLPEIASAYVANYFKRSQRYHSPQEAEFFRTPLSELQPNVLAGLPLLAEVDAQHWVAITEADINHYPGYYLSGANGQLHTMLSPLPGEEEDGVKVRFEDELTTPWRVILIGDNPGRFIESELIRTLNPPCAIDNPSWIKPGLSAWDHWWSGEVKMEMPVIKEYIDLAAEEGWPYMLVDWQWYGPFNTPEADITKAAPQIDMPELLRYAREKNVRLWLWLYSSDVNRNDAYKEAFRLYEQWGVAGVKIDFMDRDDQPMVDWYRRIVSEAAKRHLMVDFHGAYKPDGIERTWPNLMTREGVKGNEYNKWEGGVSARHNVMLAYTRMLAGPMDYTPGGFLNVNPSDHRAQSPTLVPNTRCAELAKFVIYESPYTVVCDHPKHILGQAGADFLKIVPAEWDDTRFLSGTPDTYIALARSSGDTWFVGVMNNGSEARTVTLDTNFLPEGTYTLTYWADGKRPTDVTKKTVKIQAGKPLKVRMAATGGYVSTFKMF